MKLTKLEEQGMRLAMCLARKGGQMTLPELAGREGLSEALVAKVLGKLRAGGVVNALRGRNGGYELATDPAELSVGVILRSLGRPLLDGCFTGSVGQRKTPCPHVSDCSIRPVWEFIEQQIENVLDQITLSDLILRENDVRDQLARIDIAARGPAGADYVGRAVCAPKRSR